MQQYSFHQLSPESGCSSSGWCLSNGEGLYLIYVHKENYATHLTISKEENARLNVSWFNTLTGEFMKPAGQSGGSWEEFIPPWKGVECILIVESSE